MMGFEQLELALQTLGEVILERELTYDLVAIGGGALLLQEIVHRPTEDIDIIALARDGEWADAKPFPRPLKEAIKQVGQALSLSLEATADKDWLNSGPAILLRLGLPDGFEERLQTRRFGGLTLQLASRYDLIHLKLWAATCTSRSPRLEVDLSDLRALEPTGVEWRAAIRWCAKLDGRPDFFELHAEPVLGRLGVQLEVESG